MTKEQNFKIELIKLTLENFVQAGKNVILDEIILTFQNVIDELPENLRTELKKLIKQILIKNGYKL